MVKPHRAALVQALAGALVYTVLGLATSIYVQQIVDSVLADGRVGPLHVLTAAMLAIVVAQTVIGGLRSALMMHVGQHIDAALILGYYGHLLTLPLGFFDKMRVGELTSRITDAVKIRAFVGDVIVDAIANVLVVTSATAMMFAYDWRLAAWTIGTLPAYAALYAIASRVNRRQQRLLMERGAALESQIVESLSAMGTVKRFGLEEHISLGTEAKFVRLFSFCGRRGADIHLDRQCRVGHQQGCDDRPAVDRRDARLGAGAQRRPADVVLCAPRFPYRSPCFRSLDSVEPWRRHGPLVSGCSRSWSSSRRHALSPYR